MAKPKNGPGISSALEALPAAELDVLAFLWRCGPATASDIRHGIALFRPMAHGSAVTLLKRLEEKRLVAPTGKQGKAFIYTATPKPEATYRRLIGNMLDRVFGGNALSLVSSLFADRPPKPDEVEQLRELLDQLASRRSDPAVGEKAAKAPASKSYSRNPRSMKGGS